MNIPSPATAASFPTAVEAEAMAQILHQHQIQAMVVGDFTSEFVTETNTEVRVVVNSSDLAAARALISELESEAEVDWSQVDVGDPTDVTEDERESHVSPSKRSPQFPLAMLFILQFFIAATCLVIRLPYRDLGDLMLPVLMAALCLAAIIGLTVKLASNLERLAEIWKVIVVSCATVAVMWLVTALFI